VALQELMLLLVAALRRQGLGSFFFDQPKRYNRKIALYATLAVQLLLMLVNT